MATDAPNGSQNLNGNERETNTPNSNPNPNPPPMKTFNCGK